MNVIWLAKSCMAVCKKPGYSIIASGETRGALLEEKVFVNGATKTASSVILQVRSHFSRLRQTQKTKARHYCNVDHIYAPSAITRLRLLYMMSNSWLFCSV